LRYAVIILCCWMLNYLNIIMSQRQYIITPRDIASTHKLGSIPRDLLATFHLQKSFELRAD